MDDSKTLQKSLILAVIHLCSRTREFAEGEARHPLSLAPVRESVAMVRRTIDALEALWDPAAPTAQSGDPAEASWLLEPADEALGGKPRCPSRSRPAPADGTLRAPPRT